jgi:S1-C subfamily serine protease
MYRPIHIAAIALLSFTVGCVAAASLLLVGGLPFQAGGSWAASRHDSDSDRLESSLESNAASGPAHSYADAVSRAAPAVVNTSNLTQHPDLRTPMPTP